MKKNTAKLEEKMIFIFLIISPIIDAITGIFKHNAIPFDYISIIFKGLFLVYLILKIVDFNLKFIDRKVIFYFFVFFVFFIIYFLTKFTAVSISELITEFMYIFKYFYFPFVTILLCLYLKKHNIKTENIKKYLNYTFIVYMVLLLVPYITQTAYYSYTSGANLGSKGWFYAANEVGVISSILFFSFLNTKKITLPKYVFLILSIFIIMEIGTKVSGLSIILIILYFFVKNICIKQMKESLKLLSLVAVSIVAMTSGALGTNTLPFFSDFWAGLFNCFSLINTYNMIILLTYSTIITLAYSILLKYKNLKHLKIIYIIVLILGISYIMALRLNDVEYYNCFIDSDPSVSLPNENIPTGNVLSSRDTYLQNIKIIYTETDFVNQLFGIGFTNTPEFNNKEIVKLIEIDFFDIYYRYGIIGTIIYMLPFVYLGTIMLKKVFAIKFSNSFFFDTALIVSLGLGVSITAGHVLGAPAVSFYIALYIAILYYELFTTNEEESRNEKMKILILNTYNTYNYGSMMMSENFISYINKKIKANYYIENATEDNINRLKIATGIENIYADNKISVPNLNSTNKVIKVLAKIKEQLIINKVKFYDVVIILGGDTFSEIYSKNIGVYLQFRKIDKLNKKSKLFMVGQTIGPYTEWRAKKAYKVFSKINIYSRDDNSKKYLKNSLNIESKAMRDLAFLDLNLQDDYINKTTEILDNYDLKASEYICIVGTGLASLYCKDEQLFTDKFVSLIGELLKKYPKKKLVWLSHVVNPKPDHSDNTLLELLNEKYDNYISKNLVVIDEVLLPVEARIILGNGYFTVTCRMHAAVSTYQMGKPAVCLSYSPKYKGVIAEGLNMNEMVIDAKGDKLWEKDIVNDVLKKSKVIDNDYKNLNKKIIKSVDNCKKIVEKNLNDIIKKMED